MHNPLISIGIYDFSIYSSKVISPPHPLSFRLRDRHHADLMPGSCGHISSRNFSATIPTSSSVINGCIGRQRAWSQRYSVTGQSASAENSTRDHLLAIDSSGSIKSKNSFNWCCDSPNSSNDFLQTLFLAPFLNNPEQEAITSLLKGFMLKIIFLLQLFYQFKWKCLCSIIRNIP